MRVGRVVAAMVIVMVGLPLGALGSSDRQELEEAFSAWDRDGDGRLTEAEWRGQAPFDRADRDGDGVVTLEEIIGDPAPAAASTEAASSQAEEMWSRMVEGWDSDRDGALSTGEWRGRKPHPSFDANGDGLVNREEFAAAVGRSEVAPREEVAGPSSPSWERATEGWDSNEDGELSAQEWKGRLPFEKLDSNGDGRLNEVEFTAVLGGAQAGGELHDVPQEVEPPSQTVASGEFELLLRAMDSDRDGRVSLDEWNGGAADWEEFDIDDDGFITADEVP